MYSIVARLKVLAIIVTANETTEKDSEAGLKIFAKTKWAPNVFVPLRKTLTLPTYTSSADEELALFVEVWDNDNEWGLDMLVGLAQCDLKEKLLRCPSVNPDFTWLLLRNPLSNKVGGKVLVVIQVQEQKQPFQSAFFTPNSSYFPEPCIRPNEDKDSLESKVTGNMQSKTREEVVRAAQMQLESLGITPTASPKHSAIRNTSGLLNPKSPGSVQVDDIIQMLNGKLGVEDMTADKESKNSKNRASRVGQGDYSNGVSVSTSSLLQSRSRISQRKHGSPCTVPKGGQKLPNFNSESTSKKNSFDVEPSKDIVQTPRRRMAAVFTNMDYL